MFIRGPYISVIIDSLRWKRFVDPVNDRLVAGEPINRYLNFIRIEQLTRGTDWR